MRVTRTRLDPRGAPQSTNGYGQTASGRVLALPVTLFTISLAIPFLFSLGPLLLSANRLLLAVMVIPCFVMWMRGRAGPIRTADVALLLMCVWIFIGLLVVEGARRLIPLSQVVMLC